MRKLFIVVAKVFGLLQVYYGLAYVTSIIPFFAMFARTASNTGVEVTSTSFSGESLPFTLVGLLATLVLTFGVAWLLLFRTTWIADKLGIPEEQAEVVLANDSILLIGIILIGVYITAKAAPALVSGCFRPSYYENWILSSVLPPALRLLFGLFLSIRPRLVLSLLDRGEKTQGKRIIIGCLLTLALLVVAGRGVSKYQSKNQHEYSSSYTLPSNTEFVSHETKHVSRDQWYSLGETTPHSGTNGFPDFTNATIRDVVDYLKTESEMAEQPAAPLPSEGAPSDGR